MPVLSAIPFLSIVSALLAGGAFLTAGEPIWALVCAAAAAATGGWTSRRSRGASAPARRISFLKAAGLGYPAEESGAWRKRAKFFLRAVAEPRLTRSWIDRLGRPDTLPLWVERPRLGSKLQRAYLRRDWTRSARLAALGGHYDLLREIFAARPRAAIYARGLTLVRVAAAEGALDLRLVYRDQYEKEGELTLTVEDAATTLVVASISFTLGVEDDRRIAWVGGAQSGADPRVRELFNDWTKRLHGLRPKAFALWALRQLVVPWQVEALRAVSDARHVGREGRGRRSFAGRYDGFWAESEGTLRADGDWELPLAAAERGREELKASRRKAHERRYAMLAELRAELLAAHSTLAPDAPAGEAADLPRAYFL
ncbi:MAG TPA: DUF535 family protein [Opitutaceae bacterium]|jgi:hypothetical protein|nr:DUF535 family protein [Opitutaceae bacterium]